MTTTMTAGAGRPPADPPANNGSQDMNTSVPPGVQAYIDGIEAAHRPLFDRLHRLILAASPSPEITLSYNMPTYKAGGRRLYVGAWKHGISIYGWRRDNDGGFAARHSELVTSAGTIRLRPEGAAAISDEEFLALTHGALAP